MEVGELGPESHAGMGQSNIRFLWDFAVGNTVMSADAPLLGKWQQTMWLLNSLIFFGLPSSVSPSPLLYFHVYSISSLVLGFYRFSLQ
ncbi:hypothetical protein V6N11_074538 [Hibiscus sabdariffa]|uniref:Uncharacterized protein n=1 Tax=Hibiscus sabdariffa TaxID=183260 RepID=A0ABR2R3T9_9ROSI